jgi:hypothetical protein
MDLAERLGLSLTEVKGKHTSTEFVLWRVRNQKKAQEEFDRHEKLDYYLAQIAKEIYNSQRTKASDLIKIEDMLIKFTTPNKEEVVYKKVPAKKGKKKKYSKPKFKFKKQTPEQLKLLKSMWFKRAGIGKDVLT